jgi:hypothetical protein
MKCACLNTHLLSSSLLFLVVGIGHLLRIIMGWDLIVGGWAAPIWLSVLAVILTLGFAFSGLNEMKRLKK